MFFFFFFSVGLHVLGCRVDIFGTNCNIICQPASEDIKLYIIIFNTAPELRQGARAKAQCRGGALQPNDRGGAYNAAAVDRGVAYNAMTGGRGGWRAYNSAANDRGGAYNAMTGGEGGGAYNAAAIVTWAGLTMLRLVTG